ASTLGTLLSNIVPNPKGEMKVVTTRSGLAYEGPSIPTNSPLEKVDKQNTKEKTDKEHSNCPGSTAHIQPLVMPISILEPDVPRTQPKPAIPYPSRLNDQKLHEKATNQMEKFFQIFHDFHFDISFADALLLMPKFSSTIKSLLTNKDNWMEVCDALAGLADRSITHPKGVVEDIFVMVGKFHFHTDFVVVDFEADLRVSLILGRSFLRTGHALIDVYGEEIILMQSYLVSDPIISESDFSKEPIVKSSSPTLTPFGESDFFLEEIEDFLNDDSIPTGINNSLYDPEGDILFLEKLLNKDPFQLPPMDLKLAEETKVKSSVEEPLKLELKELPSYLEYAFLEKSDKLPVIIAKDLKDVEKEALIKVLKSHKQAIAWKISDIKGVDKLPVIISKDLKVDEKEALLKVLKSHKRAIAWKVTDIKGIDPQFCTHKILMEEDYKPTVQSQRRVNPKIHEVIKKVVIKLLDAEMIYPISDSPWVSPIHCVPNKGSITVVENKKMNLFLHG
nr:hypothetical protein [Tanacetum cinerariifolium]